MAKHEVEKLQKSLEKNENYSEKSHKLQESTLLVGSPCAMLQQLDSGRAGWAPFLEQEWLERRRRVGAGKNFQVPLENAPNRPCGKLAMLSQKGEIVAKPGFGSRPRADISSPRCYLYLIGLVGQDSRARTPPPPG